VLLAFSLGNGGYSPSAGLTRDAAGNLYGTTGSGGTADYGVVFKLAPSGQETVLHSFQGGSNGSVPSGGVVLDAGFLYGTTTSGGSGTSCPGGAGGTVFK
jgi:uncharacterized repeat protein (TIGR03803 family)